MFDLQKVSNHKKKKKACVWTNERDRTKKDRKKRKKKREKKM